MDVAARHRVADAVEQKPAGRVGNDLLRAPADQCVIINLTAVPRERLQREIQIVAWQRSVLRDDLVRPSRALLDGTGRYSSVTDRLPAVSAAAGPRAARQKLRSRATTLSCQRP